MKTKLEKCKRCDEETLQDFRKVEGTNSRGSYIKRVVTRCRQCGTREIINRKNGNKLILGNNKEGKHEN